MPDEGAGALRITLQFVSIGQYKQFNGVIILSAFEKRDPWILKK